MSVSSDSKTCSRCKSTKSVLAFPKKKVTPDGLDYWCMDCKREKRAEWDRAYNERHPERRRQSAVRYQRANAEVTSWASRLKKYGLDKAALEAMIDQQGGACLLCKGDLGETWTVDHDHACCPKAHTCGRCVRGILCRRCNIALGMFNEDPDLLIAASIYVTQRSDMMALAALLGQA
jgi:hypothetical protein